ncbi:ribosomal protein L7/L12 [Microbacterium tumbae]
MEWIWIALGVVAAIGLFAALGRSMRPQVPKAPQPMPAASPASARPAGPAALPAHATAEIDRLVREGQKIAAIKVYKDTTGVGLKEAKDRIDRWQLGAVPSAATHAAPTTNHSLSDPARRELDRLVAGNQRIAAIKVLREQTGLGLKESKDIIDRWVPGQSRL